MTCYLDFLCYEHCYECSGQDVGSVISLSLCIFPFLKANCSLSFSISLLLVKHYHAILHFMSWEDKHQKADTLFAYIYPQIVCWFPLHSPNRQYGELQQQQHCNFSALKGRDTLCLAHIIYLVVQTFLKKNFENCKTS